MTQKEYVPPRSYLTLDWREPRNEEDELRPSEVLAQIERINDNPLCDTLCFLFTQPGKHAAHKLLIAMALEARGKYDYTFAGVTFYSERTMAFWYRRNHLGDV